MHAHVPNSGHLRRGFEPLLGQRLRVDRQRERRRRMARELARNVYRHPARNHSVMHVCRGRRSGTPI